MEVLVVGSGKLANELLTSLKDSDSGNVIAWNSAGNASRKNSIVVHAGSGRELEEVIAYCRETGSVLVELATGTNIADRALGFPVVLCPNTNILMLKFMAMLAASGHRFHTYRRQVIESHQAEKSSTPGTAVSLAQYLGVRQEEVMSVRDPVEQSESLKIPAEYLSRHAYHRIVIEDSLSSITLETKVFGPAPYAEGLSRIIAAIRANTLENRCYNIIEFVESGWI